MINPFAYTRVGNFLMAWVTELQKHKDRVISASPFGWSDTPNGKIEGFTFGGHTWLTAGGSRPALATDPVLSEQYMPAGDLMKWQAAARMITDQKRPALDAILAAAFAGPLTRFTGHNGLMLNVYSAGSGKGKSTAMAVAQAVWGHPVVAMQSLRDTITSANIKLDGTKHLPMFWDELKSEEQMKDFTALQFGLSGGRDRSRATTEGKLRKVGNWRTMLISACNDSLVPNINREMKSTTAGLYRVFECVVAPGTIGQLNQALVTRQIGDLQYNFGMAGLEYAKFLASDHAACDKEVLATYIDLCNITVADNDERFWCGVSAALLAGAKFGNQLGLTEIDIPALRKFLLDTIEVMRGHRAVTSSDLSSKDNIDTLFTQFFKTNRARNTLITDTMSVGRGRPAKGAITVLSDVSRLETINVHIAKNDGYIRVSRTALNDFFGHAGVLGAVTQIIQTYHPTESMKSLGSGTQFAWSQERVLEFDIRNPGVAGLVKGAMLFEDNVIPFTKTE